MCSWIIVLTAQELSHVEVLSYNLVINTFVMSYFT